MALLRSETPLSAKTAFAALSILLFFFAAQVSLTIYVDSSYLTHTIANTPSMTELRIWEDPSHMVGTLYTFASLVTLIALLYAPRILRKNGNFKTTLTAFILHVLLLIGLSVSESAWLIIPLFIVEAALISILYFNLDVFLERYSTDAETGVIRGFFLFIGSTAWLLPPFFAGKLVDTYGFQLVYFCAAIIVLPTIFIMLRYFSGFQDLTYDDAPLLISKEDSAKHPDVGRILTSNFFMHFFYAWMIIYAPLYFHNVIGMSYEDFGLVLTVALSAFVIIPYPAGWIADRVLGEKELLVTGFLLMAITSALIPTMANADLGLFGWAILLFIGRIGASTVETMNETYFFKQIDGKNAGLMGYFRRSRPLAFIVAPIAASLLLEFKLIDMSGLFYVLAAIMVVAIYFPLKLVDTR